MFVGPEPIDCRRVFPGTAADLRAVTAQEGSVADHNISLAGGDIGGSALEALTRPMTILVGHSGSGKTEIAVNLAFGLRRRGAQVTLVDLDLVKPYFRCRLAKDDLEARGIRLVAPQGDRFYADLPILVPEARTPAGDGTDGDSRVILDVGGNDLGARVLGSFAGMLDRMATDLLFVVNANRPFAEDLLSLRTMLYEVQAAGPHTPSRPPRLPSAYYFPA